MSRWAYLIPRLIVLGLLAILLKVSVNPIARHLVVGNLEQLSGSHVEIGQFHFDVENKKLLLEEFAIADPKNALQNLVQMDMAYVSLDPAAIVDRRLIIEQAQTSGVVFGSPRTTPHPKANATSMPSEPWKPKRFTSTEDLAQNWVDQLTPVNSPENGFQFETNKLQLSETDFAKQLDTLEQAIDLLQSSREQIEVTSQKQVYHNPLRKNKFHQASHFDSFRQQSSQVGTHLVELEQLLQKRQAELTQAVMRDKLKLQSTYDPQPRFNADSLSKLLLQPMYSEFVGEVIGLVHSFYNVIPNRNSSVSISKRGVDIAFPGIELPPQFLVKRIDLEGHTVFAGRQFDFAGVAFNLTDAPQLHPEPASFEIRAQEDQHFVISCVLDRRKEISHDRFSVVCPNIQLANRSLGSRKAIEVELDKGSLLQAEIKLDIVDEIISGDIVFQHSNVRLNVERLHELAGGKAVATQMNLSLANLKQFQSKIGVTGSISDYQFQTKSDLGSQFADSVNQVLSQNSRVVYREREKELDELLNRQRDLISNKLLPRIQSLSRRLAVEKTTVANLEQQHASKKKL